MNWMAEAVKVILVVATVALIFGLILYTVYDWGQEAGYDKGYETGLQSPRAWSDGVAHSVRIDGDTIWISYEGEISANSTTMFYPLELGSP